MEACRSGIHACVRLARGGRVLTLTDFEVDNGPDLRVYLVPGRARTESEVRDSSTRRPQGNKGDQQYVIPRRVRRCRAFSVRFAQAAALIERAGARVTPVTAGTLRSSGPATAGPSDAMAEPIIRSGVPELTCQELVELVTDYLEDTLAPAERARVDAHLDQCPGCRAYLHQMEATLRVVRSARALEERPEVTGLLRAFRDWHRDRPAGGGRGATPS